MADTHETIADIRKDAEAKFRKLVESYMQRRAAFQTTVGAMQAFNTVFDRLEAAWKRDTKELRVEIERLKEERNYSGVRERERLRAKGFAIVPKEQLDRGDAAKLREALELARLYISLGPEEESRARVKDGQVEMLHAVDVLDAVSAALAAPPRNCDVGTAKEQSARYDKFCYDHRTYEKCCGGCPLNGEPCCELAWAQMPYEEGGAE